MQPQLHRGLRRIDVIALTVNVMVAAGIFALPGSLGRFAGRYAVAILIAAFCLTACLALALVEVASRFEQTGGPQIYAAAAFGPLPGFIVGWLMILSRLASFGAIANVMMDYGGKLWPALASGAGRATAIATFTALLVMCNVRGVTSGTRLGNFLTLTKLLPLTVLALTGLWLAGWNHLPNNTPTGFSTLAQAFTVALFACFGFEQPSVVAGEMANPRRDIAPGILTGFAIACALYLLTFLACCALVPDLAASQLPLVDAAAALLGATGAHIMTAAAVLSCAGSLAGLMVVSPRIFFALAAGGDLPRPLAGVHERYLTPHAAIWLTALGAGWLAISGSFVYLATLVVIARLTAYASTSAALLVLRRKHGPAPVPVRGGIVLSGVAVLGTIAVLTTVSIEALRDVSIALLAGLLLRYVTRRRAAPLR